MLDFSGTWREPRVGERASRAFGMASRAEALAFEPVEGAFRREEAESGAVDGDDAGGAAADFDDIGVRHAYPFAGKIPVLQLV